MARHPRNHLRNGGADSSALNDICELLFRLRELILANIAEAEFIELTVSQLVQSIDHVVVTTFKGSIDSGRLYYR